MTPEGEGNMQSGKLDGLGEFVRSSVPGMTAEQQAKGFERLTARMDRARRPFFRGYRLSFAGMAVAAIVAAWVWTGAGRTPRGALPAPLTFKVEQGTIVEGGYIQSQADNGTTVTFSEGTTLGFTKGARGRLRSVSDLGARIALEHGQAEVKVIHKDGAQWLLDAGPFLIQVQGTTFTVEWDSREERLELRMTQGKVSVTVPLSEGTLSVRGGQRLSINLPKRAVLIEEDGVAAEAPPAPTEVPPLLNHPNRTVSLVPAHRVRPMVVGPFRWGTALAAGNLDSIFKDVDRVGLDRSLSLASSEDLAALGDAARYRKSPDLSRKAFAAQRDRFPGSDRAHDAAFHLGRLSESSDPDGASAVAWYDRYLSEAPGGAYASEALGRKMTSLKRRQGNAAAATVAEEYLRRFPQGTYAGAAAAIRKSP